MQPINVSHTEVVRDALNLVVLKAPKVKPINVKLTVVENGALNMGVAKVL